MPAAEVDAEPQPALVHGDRVRQLGRVGRPDVEAFETLDVLVGADDELVHARQLREQPLDQLQPLEDAQGEDLDGDPVGVALGDQAAQAVALGVDEAVGVGAGLAAHELLAPGDGRLEPRAEESSSTGAAS